MAKIRVYELARELGVESGQVLATLAANGESIRSASSALEPEVAQAVREKLQRLPATDEQPPGAPSALNLLRGGQGLLRLFRVRLAVTHHLRRWR